MDTWVYQMIRARCRRRVAAWLTVGAFFLTFMPEPMTLVPPSPMFDGEKTLVTWQATERPRPRGALVVPFHQAPRPMGMPL